jgi:hyperosmotically inducible protein
MNAPRPRLAALAAALAAVFALSACNRNPDEQTAGQNVDEAVARTEQKAEDTRAEMDRNADQAKQATQESTEDAKRAVAEASDKATSAVSDAAITTSINAELAKDGKLSATKINVDTSQGRVALRGSAPDPEAKDRATRIAANVKGVMSVDNLLTVENS